MAKLRTFQTISASSIETFEACPRQWWYTYVLGHRSPSTPAQAHGTKVHADIEHYLSGRKKALETVEAIEAKAQGHIPDPSVIRDRGAVELDLKGKGLTLPVPGTDTRLRALGLIDLLFVPAHQMRDGKNPDAVIRDWKVRGSLRYAPEGDALHENTQARFYAWAFFALDAGARAVLFEHGNMLRVDGAKGRTTPRSVRHGTTFTREEIEAWADGPLASTIARMWETSQAARPHLTRKDTGSCFRYGRCYFQQTPLPELMGATCEETPCSLPDPAAPDPAAPGTHNPTGENAMNILDIMKKRNEAAAAAKTEAAAPATPAAPPAPSAPADPAPPGDAEYNLSIAQDDYREDPDNFDIEAYDLTPAQIREFVSWQASFRGEASSTLTEASAEPGVNPLDADDDSAPADPSTMRVEDFPFTDVRGIGPKGATNLIALAKARGWSLSDLLTVDLTAAEGIGAKGAERIKEAIRAAEPWSPGKEARDAEAKVAAETPLLAGATAAPAPPKTVVPSEAPVIASTAPKAAPRQAPPAGSSPEIVIEEKALEDGTRVVQVNPRVSILYIDCAPARGGGEVWHLEDLLAPLKRKVEEAEGWAYWNMDRYGAGKKRLLHLVMEHRDELFGGKRSVVAVSRHEGMDAVLPEIMGMFDLVVQG